MSLDPIANPQAEDVITIAGVDSPGVIPPGGVSGAKRTYKYDVKVGKGTSGSTTTFVGKPPAPFTVKFQLWQSSHFAAWDAFLPLLKYDPTKKAAQAFDIYHPVLAELDIKSVVTTDIGGRVHEGKGLYSYTVEFLEYAPASKKSAVSTPSGSQTNPGGWTAHASPGTQADPAVAALEKQAADLAKQAQGIA